MTTPPHNIGKGIDHVQERQRRRKMSKLKESCKQPLPFTESYNTDIAFVTLKTRTSNELVVLEYDWRSSTAASSATQSSLSSSDCEKVLYLSDEHGISDDYYHELSMIVPSLPRLYKVKHLREYLSSQVNLVSLPSPYKGSFVPLKPLLSSVISKQLEEGIVTSPIEIKISGDGAPISRTTSLIRLSFTLPFLNDLSSHNKLPTLSHLQITFVDVHTFAVIE
jgi:hypothetical protein